MSSRHPAKPGPVRRSTAQRLVRATRHSWQGLKVAWHREQAFREEVVVLMLLLPVGWWLGEGAVERALLLGSLFPVLIAELLNSALEAAVDRQGLERDALAGSAKDMGSAAVLLALVLAALVWGILLLS